MATLATQLRDKFFGLVGCITSCGRAGDGHKDAAGAMEPMSAPAQHLELFDEVGHVEIRSRGGAPKPNGGSTDHHNEDDI
ncbi:hypothetical protein EJB05_09416 [Eragrostis curvula]|uniref:Uncharacterized protein n=1 Tax=Eragrostis curvula TaxID=38414 RepID=A0A5J9W4X5_9POAL|nr:hypothetical protein EJB05_09416 [Eragrostis curvula]